MGALMKEDDIYIGTFLDLFNLRFAPNPSGVYGGIEEMSAVAAPVRTVARLQ
jgi:hypothetical protein